METPTTDQEIQEIETVTIRFAGDSGDGMQLTGTQFTDTAAMFGNDVATFPDYPAEIRAPAGSLPGVSAFQLCFSKHDILTPGDHPNVLVAMNPAALKVNLADLASDGLLIVNEDAFNVANLQKASYETNPLEDGSLAHYRLYKLPISSLTAKAVEPTGVSSKEAERCKNFFVLGLLYWLYDRKKDQTIQYIQEKFGKKPQIAEANILALKAGWNFANTVEIFQGHYRVAPADLAEGLYRRITGNEAAAMGLIAASLKSGLPLFYGSYPITPASDILHYLAAYKNYGVKTFQAEDEIAAMGSVIGAAYAGHLAVTGTSGPGVSLKSEAIGLAVMTELPMVIANVQRGGPSTGLPTKTEQADLLQALYGRHGECPVAIVAPATPTECFHFAIQAAKIALEHMTPVFFLSDGYLANGAEPWKIPDEDSLPDIHVEFATNPETFRPYSRDPKTMARPWAIPGTPLLEHRIGGLEKEDVSGAVCYEPENHERMIHLRQEKIAKIADFIPDLTVNGDPEGKILVVGWGSTYGSITSAVNRLRRLGHSVSNIHIRYLNPFPKNLGDILGRYETVIAPEMNLGQLALILRATFLVDVKSYTKVKGQPFKITEIVDFLQPYL